MHKRVLNFVLFQIAWFACVLAAERVPELAGLAVALGLLALHFAWSSTDRRAVALTILRVAPLGFLLDTLLSWTGVLEYRGTPLLPGAAPAWILVLWAWFAATCHGSLAWLQRRPLAACLLGAIGAPLSYAAGARLSAVQFSDPASTHVVIVAAAWGAAMPLFLALARASARR